MTEARDNSVLSVLKRFGWTFFMFAIGATSPLFVLRPGMMQLQNLSQTVPTPVRWRNNLTDANLMYRTICRLNSPREQHNLTIEQHDFLHLNDSICRGVQVPGDLKASRVSQPVFYATAKFRVGKRRWITDLKEIGCRVLKSTSVPKRNIFVFRDEFPSSLLRHPMYERHRQFLINETDDSSRGAGYWFWKPLIILGLLQSENVPNKSYIVYTDADRPDAIGYTGRVVENMAQRGHDFALQQWKGGEETAYTKGDTFTYFGLHGYGKWPETKTPQYSANFFVVQKSPHTIEFFTEWANLMGQYHLVSDEHSKAPNSPGFYDNRHDQSMLSMLLKFVYHDGGASKTALKLDLNNPYVGGSKSYVSLLTTYTYSLERSRISPLDCSV